MRVVIFSLLMPLHRPGTPGQRQRHCHQYALDARGEAARAASRQRPRANRPRRPPVGARDAPKCPRHLDGLRHLRRSGDQGRGDSPFGRIDLPGPRPPPATPPKGVRASTFMSPLRMVQRAQPAAADVRSPGRGVAVRCPPWRSGSRSMGRLRSRLMTMVSQRLIEDRRSCPNAACPPWPPDNPGQTSRRPRRHPGPYTTTRDTIPIFRVEQGGGLHVPSIVSMEHPPSPTDSTAGKRPFYPISGKALHLGAVPEGRDTS